MFNKYRRLLAFLLDMFIVVGLALFISSNYKYNPKLYDMEDAYKEFESIRPTMEDFNKEKFIEYISDASNKAYNLAKSQVYVYGWYILFYFLYFVVFAYFTEGQTLGKRIMKLKIVKSDGKRVGILNLLLRSITNGTSYFLGTNIYIILNIIGVLILNGIPFLGFLIVSNGIGFIVEATNIIMYIFRKDDRCLNDIVSKSKVIVLR